MRINELLFKWKYFILVAALLSSIVYAQVFNTVAGVMIMQGEYVWSCFGDTRVCAKIHKDQFCVTKNDRNFISCEDTLVEF